MAELRVIIDTEDGKKTMVPYTKIDNFNKYADLKQVIKNRYTKNIGPLRQNIVLNYNKENVVDHDHVDINQEKEVG